MAWLSAFALLNSVTSVHGWQEKVREIYMYRATKDPTKNPYVMENVDMADLVGAMKYVHSEVIAEHTISIPDRTARKYNIDTIARWRVLVQNPGVITGMNQAPMIFADFGPFITFDYGQATNEEPRKLLERLGDFVGAQQNSGDGFVYDEPYFWFSLPGFCPNLPYRCTNGWTDPDQGGGEKCEHEPAIHTAMCLAPPNKPGPCPSKGTREKPRFIEGNRRVSCTPVPFGTVLQGGLCGSHTGKTEDVRLQEPAGIPGCVYSYDPKEVTEVKLDDLVGLKNEDCGGRMCKNWLDFRNACTNKAYKQKFENTMPPEVRQTDFCVEYDIHPACARSCTDPACLEVAEDKRELGLPFWKGRCNAAANRERMEGLAHLFGVPGALDKHQVLQPPTKDFQVQICDRSIDGFHPGGMAKGTLQCKPNTPMDLFGGGPFCTRAWGGVCRTCRIEGMKHEFPDKAQPACPLDVLKPAEYAKKVPLHCKNGACCLSNKPSEKCCLYFDTCHIKLADVPAAITGKTADGKYEVPLDEELAELVDAKHDTAVALSFLKRVASEFGNVKDADIEAKVPELTKLAYKSWGTAPKVGSADLLEKAKQDIVGILPNAGPTPPPTEPPATPAPTPAPAPPPAPPASGDSGDGGGGGGIWIVLIILLLLGGGGAAFFMMQKKKRDPLIGGVNEMGRR